MTDRHDGNEPAGTTAAGRPTLQARWARLAALPAPPVPPGAVGELSDRVLVYTQADKVPVVLPHLDTKRSGLVISGLRVNKRMRLLEDAGYRGPILVDPAAYEKRRATPAAPFVLPEDRLEAPSLHEVLDEQRAAGASAALTPTGFIGAGDTGTLRVAVQQVRELGRDDIIFVAPLDISLLDRKYIRATTAILADANCPIALVLGGQFDPLEQSARIIPNLRDLAVSVELMPIRTDFNALDLIAHGAFAAAIGTGGKTRHTVKPGEKAMSGDPNDRSPSVLVPELVCWWRGSTIANRFGARPSITPRCDCAECGGQRLSRFLRQTHQNAAIAHAVARWSRWVDDLLDAATMRDRAQYWRNLCAGAVDHHRVFTVQLQSPTPLRPQEPIRLWATLPAWPGDAELA